MNQFSLLPLAKKISDSFTVDDAYNRKNLGISIPSWFFILLFLAMLAGFAYNIISGIFLFGLSFLMAGLNNNGIIAHNNRIVANNLWNNLPFTIIGLSIMVLCISFFFSDEENTDTGSTYHLTPANKLIIKLYIAFLIALIIGRLIFIIASFISLSNRRKSCTYAVEASYCASSSINPKQIYLYQFEGEIFAFIYKVDNIYNWRYPNRPQDFIQVYIDPDAPEKYYFYDMQKLNVKKLKNYFTVLFILLLIIVFIFGPFFWIKYIEPSLNPEW